MLTHEVLAATLASHGVDTVFGVVGEGNIALATSLAREHGVRYFAARREDGAIAMADGFARASTRVGVATVTYGPGLTNTITALTEAVRACTPLVLLAGATGVGDRINRQSIDQRWLAEATGASVVDTTAAHDAVADVLNALSRAAVSRTPVVVNLPSDLQEEALSATRACELLRATDRLQPDPPCVAKAAQTLAEARRPVLLAGRGAVLSGAHAELDRLAALTGAAVCTTLFAKGFFADNPVDVGICGGFSSGLAKHVITEADCIVAFGAGLNRWTTGKGSLLRGPVIHCDVEPAAFGLWYEPQQVVAGDASATAAALADLIDAQGPSSEAVSGERGW